MAIEGYIFRATFSVSQKFSFVSSEELWRQINDIHGETNSSGVFLLTFSNFILESFLSVIYTHIYIISVHIYTYIYVHTYIYISGLQEVFLRPGYYIYCTLY